MKGNIKKKAKSIHHLIVSILFISRGADNIESNHQIIGWALLIGGFLVMVYFAYIKFKNHEDIFLSVVIHIFESIAFFLTTYILFQEGKTYLQYMTLLAGIGFFIAAGVQLFKIKNKRRLSTETR